MAAGFDSHPPLWQGAAQSGRGSHAAGHIFVGELQLMVKPEWGTKRTCPKCATRFYDLGKDDPVTCIECGAAFVPEPVLKSKQPMPFEAVSTTAAPAAAADEDLGAEDLALPDEDEEPSADDEVDLSTGDDDLGVETAADDEENI
jgi:uncharacterized protein (TIGR02300 family)